MNVTQADAYVDIYSEGKIDVNGLIEARATGADIFIGSDNLINVNNLIYANDTIGLDGGSSLYGAGVVVTALSKDVNGEYLSGGLLKTDNDGSIFISSDDDIMILGAVGELSAGNALTSDIILTTISGDITLHGTSSDQYARVDAKDSVAMSAKNINILESSLVSALGDGGYVTLEATKVVYIGASSSESDAVGRVEADTRIHLKADEARIAGAMNVDDGGDGSNSLSKLYISVESLAFIEGTVTSSSDIYFHAGVDATDTLVSLEAAKTLDN